MNLQPFFLVALSLIEAYALWKAYRDTKIVYLLIGAIRIALFMLIYTWIGIAQPSAEVSRAFARPLFVLMQSIAAAAAVIWLAERKGSGK